MKALLGDLSLLAGYAQKTGVSWLPCANGSRWEDFCTSCSSDIRPCVLLAGPLQREVGDLTSVLNSESLLGDHSLLAGYAQKARKSILLCIRMSTLATLSRGEGEGSERRVI